jgi:chloride channel 3/4/5
VCKFGKFCRGSANPCTRISFKRKQKAAVPSPFGISRFLSPATSSNRSSPAPRGAQSRLQQLRTGNRASDSTDQILNYLDQPAPTGEQPQDAKDGNGLDWYVEGPGRRVGYDDLTAIDWIFEYAKERQRLRYLYSSASGILGHVKQIADASQIWIILIAAGILSGGIAAFIDVVSDWLGDLKTGYCSNVDGDGRFYLNKGFCCWGYSELSQCNDWHPWSSALGIRSMGGGWIVEYIFFVVFSVSCFPQLMMIRIDSARYCLLHVPAFSSGNSRRMRNTVVSLRSRQSWVAS